MEKQIFISYHFNDRQFKSEIKKWLQGTGTRIVSVDENTLQPAEDDVLQKQIREQIRASSLLLVLVGAESRRRPWAGYAVTVARSLRVPAYWVRLSGRPGTPPKEVKSLRLVGYNPAEIGVLLRSLQIIERNPN